MLKVPAQTQLEIEAFLAHEARLLEDGHLDEWLDLLAGDLHYLMPIRESVDEGGLAAAQPGMSFALFDDDKNSIRLRARRMQSKVAPTEVPPPLVQRLVTNIQVLPTADANEFLVHSKFMVHQERRGRHVSMFVGSRDDVLRRTGESWLIARREVRLAQTLLPTTISIFF